jgi:hypothetical protein
LPDYKLVNVCLTKIGSRTAACLPDVNGLQVDALWDSGAEVTLVRQTTADDLVTQGAGIEQLVQPVRVTGLGDGAMIATEQLICTVTFSDSTKRTLVPLIVKNLPYSVIVGLDFMSDQEIGFLPTSEGVQLFDNRVEGRPVIFSGGWKDEAATEHDPYRNRYTHVNMNKRLGAHAKRGVKNYQKRWAAMEDSDKELIDTMANLQISKLTDSEVLERLTRSKSVCSARLSDVKSEVKSERMTVPMCDFPEAQQRLEKLISLYPGIFSSSTADVGKSSGNKVSIKLAIDSVVNIRNYRTP